MAQVHSSTVPFEEDDHRAAFIFSSGEDDRQLPTAASRPAKKRKLAGAGKKAASQPQLQQPAFGSDSTFIPLFNGAESPEAVNLRKELFEASWPVLETRIQHVLREANRSTLDEVTAFLQQAAQEKTEKITAGFIITGPNIVSQDLLFEQLSERLYTEIRARVVRLRASEVSNLKAALKKIIRDATANESEDDDGSVVVPSTGRKYLDYDLDVLYVFLSRQQQQSRRVVIAFQDSEAFDSSLLADLITLFHSWSDRIQFDVLFGVATSVELFQARLPRSTARLLYGAQFDVVQANSVLESVVKTAVAGSRATLRIGPSLLRSLVDRQQEQVAGIQLFVSSVKYAYMCHFYANPLSVLLAKQLDRKLLQPEHLRAVRMLESFKAKVEVAIDARQMNHAQAMIEDDDYLIAQILEQQQKCEDYLKQLLRTLHLISSTGLSTVSFTELYMTALSKGIDLEQADEMIRPAEVVRRMNADEFLNFIQKLLHATETGSPELELQGWASEAEEFVDAVTELRGEVEGLMERSKHNGTTLRSQYSAQSKVLRTTVVAQKVQLSQDTAALTEEDKAYTKAIDTMTALLSQYLRCEPINNLFLHEIWVYDSKLPYREVFVPRPGAAFARGLSRPHDYLACACCSKVDGGLSSTLPTTCILYHLYLEAGALINVADLWSAYYGLVGNDDDGSMNREGLDERSALVCFYRGLAELRMMGLVKQSRKRADHIAKLKWL